MKSRVLVIGSACMELLLPFARLPEKGASVTETEHSFQYRPGGSGASLAVALAHLGLDTVLCARLGNDSAGARLRRLYEREEVDVRFVEMDPTVQTGLCAVLSGDGGEPRRLAYPGAAAYLSAAQVELAMTCLPDVVCLELSAPEEALVAGAELARKKGLPLFADGVSSGGLSPEALGPLEIFAPEEDEVFRLTGIRPADAESCLRACIKLGNRVRAQYIVLKLGRRGCFAYDGKFYHLIPWPGEGGSEPGRAKDAFTACLLAAYLDGDGMAEACRFAVHGASLASRKAASSGGYRDLPRRGDVVRWMAES